MEVREPLARSDLRPAEEVGDGTEVELDEHERRASEKVAGGRRDDLVRKTFSCYASARSAQPFRLLG